jgi:GDP-L-fucose synthase
LKAIIGATGFLARTIQRVIDEPLQVLGSRDFDLLKDDPPKVDDVDCVIYCADYYPGLDATAENPDDVWRVNVAMFDKLFKFLAVNAIPKVITIGTTGCYPITDDPLSESMFNGDPSRLNPKLYGYALSRFTLLDMAALWRERNGLAHHHLIIPNFYGPGDKYEAGRSHLMSSWIRDFWDAKQRGDEHIELWGLPTVKREFMYVDDVASYVLKLSGLPLHREVLNVGYGLAPTYEEVAVAVLEGMDFMTPDRLTWDTTKRGKRSQEVMDESELDRYRMELPKPMNFKEGVKATVADYLERHVT